MADLLHAKICRTLVALRRASEVVDHFKAHVAYYKHTRGPPSIPFCHEAWMCLQYYTFAELLESLPPSAQGSLCTRQHNSGYYFEAAASHARNRKLAAREAQVDESSFIADRSGFGPNQVPDDHHHHHHHHHYHHHLPFRLRVMMIGFFD